MAFPWWLIPLGIGAGVGGYYAMKPTPPKEALPIQIPQQQQLPLPVLPPSQVQGAFTDLLAQNNAPKLKNVFKTLGNVLNQYKDKLTPYQLSQVLSHVTNVLAPMIEEDRTMMMYGLKQQAIDPLDILQKMANYQKSMEQIENYKLQRLQALQFMPPEIKNQYALQKLFSQSQGQYALPFISIPESEE